MTPTPFTSELVARRLAINFMRSLNLQELIFQTDEEQLHLDPTLRAQDDFTRSQHGVVAFFRRLLFWLRKEIHIYGRISRRHERRVNFNDVINRELIMLIFPSRVLGTKAKQDGSRMEFFSFMETQLNLASGYTTPRVVISFFDKALREARRYYSANRDIASIPKNAAGEYPLIGMESIAKAYQELKDEAWEVEAKVSLKWESAIHQLRAKLSGNDRVEFKDFSRAFEQLEKDELQQFIAFITHIGMVKCHNPRIVRGERIYSFPLLFRDV